MKTYSSINRRTGEVVFKIRASSRLAAAKLFASFKLLKLKDYLSIYKVSK